MKPATINPYVSKYVLCCSIQSFLKIAYYCRRFHIRHNVLQSSQNISITPPCFSFHHGPCNGNTLMDILMKTINLKSHFTMRIKFIYCLTRANNDELCIVNYNSQKYFIFLRWIYIQGTFLRKISHEWITFRLYFKISEYHFLLNRKRCRNY